MVCVYYLSLRYLRVVRNVRENRLGGSLVPHIPLGPKIIAFLLGSRLGPAGINTPLQRPNVRPSLARGSQLAKATSGVVCRLHLSILWEMLSMSMTQKRQLALCLRNTVVGMTLSFILWQAWSAANDLASE